MKLVTLFLTTYLSFFAHGQVPDVKGEIQTTGSMPGTYSFVITGEVAETIYNQLKVIPFPNASFPPGEVSTKVGESISCDQYRKLKSYSCQFATTEKGIFVR